MNTQVSNNIKKYLSNLQSNSRNLVFEYLVGTRTIIEDLLVGFSRPFLEIDRRMPPLKIEASSSYYLLEALTYNYRELLSLITKASGHETSRVVKQAITRTSLRFCCLYLLPYKKDVRRRASREARSLADWFCTPKLSYTCEKSLPTRYKRYLLC